MATSTGSVCPAGMMPRKVIVVASNVSQPGSAVLFPDSAVTL